MLLDTHCHLHDLVFFSEAQQAEFLQNAHDNGIEQIICIGTDPEDSLRAKSFAEAHNNVFWTYGIHPEEADRTDKLGFSKLSLGDFLSEPHFDSISQEKSSERSEIKNFSPDEYAVKMLGRDAKRPGGERLKNPCSKLVAIGEVGLDYHSEGYDRTAQIDLFNEMLSLATDLDLPVSFHIRNAFPDFFGVIANFPQVRGVVHSFTDSKKTLKKLLDTTDFYIGVNGLATYSTLPTPPLDRILLETDAPFLTPVPFRGIINQPAYIKNIAEWLSNYTGVSLTEIEEITTKNGQRLFHLPDPTPVFAKN